MIDVERIKVEYNNLDIPLATATVIAAIPYAVGWLVGYVARLVLWCIAAIVAGYKSGLGSEQ